MAHARFIAAALLGLVALGPQARADLAVSPNAQRIFQVIDGLDVEHNWPAGVHINWRTGVPDGKPETAEGKHTHCSAFAAAAAEALGIYLLHPPEHPQTLLANAQFEWLKGDGQQQGWVQLKNASEAQQYADNGFLVVAAYENPDPQKPGHVAIIRPGTKTAAQLSAEGPDETQAGLDNFKTVAVKKGFADHKGAFDGNGIGYFAHPVDPAKLPPQ